MDTYYHKCIKDPRLKCFPRLWGVCPHHSTWEDIVTLWGTTLGEHSFDVSLVEGDGGNFRSNEEQIIARIEVPRLLADPDTMIEYCNTGRITHDICLDLVRSRFLWGRTRQGSPMLEAVCEFQRKFKGVIRDWTKSKSKAA